MKKRLLGIIMCICLVGAMLAACSSSTEATTTAATTEAATTEAATTVEETTEMQIPEGASVVEDVIHFDDGSFASAKIVYTEDGWTATVINESANLNDKAEGTFEGTKMVGDYKNLDLLQELFNTKTVTNVQENVDFGVFQSDVNLNYNDILWDATFYLVMEEKDVTFYGTIDESGNLVVKGDPTEGYGEALVTGGVQGLYTASAGKTVTGIAQLMSGATEVTIWYNNTNWTADLYVTGANEYVHLEGTIGEDGTLTLVEDSSGGFGSAMMEGIQGLYEDCLAGTVTTETSDVPSDAAESTEVTLPNMEGMKFFVEQIDMGGMDTPDMFIGFSDTTWVCTYFFNPVSLSVCLHGTIEDGKLVVAESNNQYASGDDVLTMIQAQYEKGLAAGGNMTLATKELDFNGMATVPVNLYFNDNYWVVTYNFAMADKNVLVCGTIDNGTLVVVNDPTGMGADMLAGYQEIYDENK